MTDHVFISYARRDGVFFAERLDEALQRTGLSTWCDYRHLDPAQDFTAELEKAIEAAQQVVVCLTPDSKREDSFVRREIQYALAQNKPIIPLRFAEVVPPIHIVNLTYIDFYNRVWETAFDELLRRLNLAARYQPPALPDDPYREYLNQLYGQIVHYLNRTVFSLIALNTEDTPDAVDLVQEQPASALPLAFFDMVADDDFGERTITPYSSFPSAFERNHGRVLLLGEPGGGKTTTLMAFAREAVARRLEDATQPLPIVAPIATWDAMRQPGLIDWLSEQIRVLNPGQIAQVIEGGAALLLLDGLDELGSEREHPDTKERFDPRQKFVEMISVMLNANPHHRPEAWGQIHGFSNGGLRVLITCRVKDYHDIGAKLPLAGAVTLRPLDDEQMRVYLEKQPDLLAAIEADPALREMARTPLLLSLFTFAYNGLADEARQLRDLAHSPGDLRDRIFETYMRRRYEREARKLNQVMPFSLEYLQDALAFFSEQTDFNPDLWPPPHDNQPFHNFGKQLVHTSALVEVQQNHQIRITDSLLDMAVQLQLLSLIDKNYVFSHALLKDYFHTRFRSNFELQVWAAYQKLYISHRIPPV
ncbi:MAG: TIR domain-containing protein [bacterium]|nr:TIR domain-containing protein [bacterium]